MAHVVVRDKDGRIQRTVELDPDVTVVGRDASCDIMLADAKVSRRHAEIRQEDAQYVLSDLDSTNGTTVNGEETAGAVLRDNDEIGIGDTLLVFSEAASPSLGDSLEDSRVDTIAVMPLPSAVVAAEGLSAVDAGKGMEAVRRRVEVLEGIANGCISAQSEDELFSNLVPLVRELVTADRVFPVLWKKRRWSIWSGATRKNGGFDPLLKAPVSMTVIETVRKKGVPVLASAEADERFREARSVRVGRIGTAMCAPFEAGASGGKGPREAGGVFAGVLYADRSQGGEAFTREELASLSGVTVQAGAALNAIRLREEAERRAARLQSELVSAHSIIGESPAILKVFDFIAHAAASSAPVLILGESGTGKELVARALHNGSLRAAGAFEVVNCAALPEGLVESELFGHAKGAFTGASSDRVGRFELADAGTLFLDEVGDLPPDSQARLLRVLESGEFSRVGESRVRTVDVRVVAATNKKLDDMVASGGFREDLFYRLNVLRVALPPLRERAGDVEILLDYFLGQFSEQAGCGPIVLREEARRRLVEHSWPGNIRELKNTIERLVVLRVSGLGKRTRDSTTVAAGDLDEILLHAPTRNRHRETHAVKLDEVVKQHILETLDAAGGNKKLAAQMLGIDRSTLYARLKEYGLK